MLVPKKSGESSQVKLLAQAGRGQACERVSLFDDFVGAMEGRQD